MNTTLVATPDPDDPEAPHGRTSTGIPLASDGQPVFVNGQSLDQYLADPARAAEHAARHAELVAALEAASTEEAQ